MRGSDPDAAVFYLAKMLYGGEDIKFIARRIMICASEDVGNADPNAIRGGDRMCTGCGTCRHAGGADNTCSGGNLCGVCTEEQFCGRMRYLRAMDAVKDDGHGSGAGVSQRCTLWRCGKAWTLQDTNMRMIIQIIMLTSSICRIRLQDRVFYEPSDNGYETGYQGSISTE